METQKRILKAIIIILSLGLIHCSPTEFRTLEAEELNSQQQVRNPESTETETETETPATPVTPKVSCNFQGEILDVNEVRSQVCASPATGLIDFRCENSGQMREIANSCMTAQAGNYQWKTSTYGVCSAKAAFQIGAWSECQNLSCSGGEQTRAVQCQATAGLQTREVYCQNAQGSRVADSYCKSAKPQAQIACQSSCSEEAPAKVQACVKGTPCLRSFHTQYLMTVSPSNKTLCGSGHDVNQTSLARIGLKWEEVHGSRCMVPTTTQQVGDYVTVASTATGNPTVWNNQHPGDCPQGESATIHSTYTCLGVCPSGQWKQVANTIGSPRISPLMGMEETPLINPFNSAFNTREVAGRSFPHYRCVGLE